MSQRADDTPRIRRRSIPADAHLVVRGSSTGEPGTSIRQAVLFRRRFPAWGRFGLSAYAARTETNVLDLAQEQLIAFGTLRIYRASALVAAGFEVVPTFRSPHVTITFYDEPELSIARLFEVRHRELRNPFRREEGRP